MPHRFIPSIDGRRGDVLLLGGIMYAIIGTCVEVTYSPARDTAFQWIPEPITANTAAVVWFVSAAWAVAVALVSRRRPRWEASGYTALTLAPMVWALAYLGATLRGTLPNGITTTALCATIVVFVWYLAGTPATVERRE